MPWAELDEEEQVRGLISMRGLCGRGRQHSCQACRTASAAQGTPPPKPKEGVEAAPKAGVLAAPKAGVCSPKAGVLEPKLEDEAAPKPPVIAHGIQQCRA